MPARLSRVKAVFAALGVHLEEPTSGSHWKLNDGRKTYPIPAHNGLKSEVSDLYIRRACATFGLDDQKVKVEL